MSTEPASAGLRRGMEEIVSSIFENMLGLSTNFLSPEPVQSSPGDIRASVEFTGSWHGTVSMECALQQARHFAARFLSLPASRMDDQIACDVLGELANMVAGNLKPLFASDIQLSTATVCQTRNELALDFDPAICIQLLLFCAEGNFVARLLAAPTHL